MKTAEAVIWGAGLAGAGVAGFYVWKNYFAAQMELPPDVSGPQGSNGGAVDVAATGITAVRVQNLERANGVREELQAFLRWWQANGPFPLLVAPDGGVRTNAAKQAQFFAQGYSKAKTLAQTPHGHSSALDLWPVGFDPAVKLEKQPVIKKRFEEMGRIAKSFGFTWGGDWGWDYPHIEVRGWKTYPMPGSSAVSGLAGLGAETPATLVSAGAVGGTSVLVLAGIGAGLWFLTRDGGSSSSGDAETECREAAERWVPKCVIQKGKRKSQS